MKKRIKRGIGRVLVLMTMVLLITSPTVAEQGNTASLFSTTLTSGDLQYTVSNDTATIVGCNEGVTSLDIPAQIDGMNVVAISNDAFSGRSTLAQLSIPEGVTYIGSAFIQGTSVKTITVPSTVTSVGTFYSNGYNGPFAGATSLEEVTIAEGMTSIPNCFCAMSNSASKLSKVTIPSTIKTIGDRAFQNCESLTAIALPEGLEQINDYAFEGCTTLSGTVELPKSLKTVGQGVFQYCTGLEEVAFVANMEDGFVRTLEANVFTGCTSLRNVELTGTQIRLGNDLFSGCTALEELTLPEGVIHMGASMIAGTNITSITVPSTVTSVGTFYSLGYNGPFAGATALEEVVFAEGTTTILNCFCAMSNSTSKLTKVTIPSTVKTIGDRAFQNCESLTAIVLPEGLEQINDYAFEGCTAVSGTVELPKSLKTLGQGVFQYCTGLEEVVFAANMEDGFVRTLEANVFTGCTSLRNVELTGTQIRLGNDLFSGCTALEELTLPEGVIHMGASMIAGTNITSITVPSTVTSIGTFYSNGYNGPFAKATMLEEVIFAEGTTTIHNCFCAMSNSASKLAKVTIPSTVKTIGNHAFQNCESLTTIALPKSLAQINGYAFEGCTALSGTVELPKSLKTLGQGVFQYCTGLEEVVFAANMEDGFVRTLEANVFTGCTALQNVELTGTQIRLGNDLFSGCTALEELTLPEGVIHMGASMIAGTNITSITVPSTVTSIGTFYSRGYNGPFAGATALEEVVFAEGTTTIHNCFCAMSNTASKLSKVTVPNTVKTIGDHAFQNCESLTAIVLPEGLEQINGYAFEGCTALSGTVELPKSLKTLGQGVFQYCTGLEEVVFADNMEEGFVRTLEANVFNGCTSLRNVELTGTQIRLGNDLFSGCTALEELTLPEGVIHMGASMIAGTNITSITVPSTVTSIGTFYSRGYNGPFAGATALKEVSFAEGTTTILNCFCAMSNTESKLAKVTIPSTIKTIGDHAFQNCESLTAIVLPEGLEQVNSYTFEGCTALSGTVELPKTLKTLGQGVFQYCTGLEGVTFGSNREVGFERTINEYAFAGCTALKHVSLSETKTRLANDIFNGCTAMTELTLPEGIVSMGCSLIRGTAISRITIPTTLTTVGTYYSNGYNGPFAGASMLDTVIFADGLTTIPAYLCAIHDSENNISKAYIPASVTKIDDTAFQDCEKLVIYCEAGSTAEKYAQNHEIAFKDIIGVRDELVSQAASFYYQVEQHRRGYSVFNTDVDFILTTAKADAAMLYVTYTDDTSTGSVEVVMEYDDYLGAYTAPVNVMEGMKSIDSAKAVVTSGGMEITWEMEDSYWYSMPFMVEGTVTAKLPDNNAQYTGMVIKLYEENGRLAGRVDIENQKTLVFHGLSAETEYSLVVYGAGHEFARFDGIVVKPGYDTLQDLSSMPNAAGLNLVFRCDGKNIAAEGITGRFYDRTEGKSRIFASGTGLTHLAEGDIIAYSVSMTEALAMEYEVIRGVTEVTLDAGENNIIVELQKIPEFTYNGKIVDAGSGLPVFNAQVSVTQILNDTYPVSYSVRTGRDGSFSLTMKKIPGKVIVRKNAYSTLTMEVAAGDYPTELELAEAGGKIMLRVGYMAAVAETDNAANIGYEGQPNVIEVRNETKDKVIARYQSSFPMLYTDETNMEAGDRITAVLRRDGYANLTLHGTVNAFGNVELGGTMYELGGILVDYVREDNQTAAVHAVLYDQNGKYIEYYPSVPAQYYVKGLVSGSYTLVLAEKSVVIDRYKTFAELQANESKYVYQSVQVKDGEIACPDSVTVPKLGHMTSILAGENRLSGKTSALIGDTVWLNVKLSVADNYAQVGKTVRLTLPTGVTIIENGVVFNNESVQYSQDEKGLAVEVLGDGLLKVGVKILSSVGASQLNFTATVEYVVNGISYTEVLGRLSLEVKAITVVVPEQTNSETVFARGIAPKSTTVQIYDNDVLVAETKSNRYGAYRVELNLDTEYKYVKHNLVAVAGVTSSEVAQLQYGTTHPVVVDFNMYHDAHVDGGTEINFNTTQEVGYFVGYFWPSKPFDFWVKFDDNDGVMGVAVQIEFTNGTDQVVPLTYNKETDYYEGSVTLKFNTVPKAFNVQYVPVTYYDADPEASYNLFENAGKELLSGENLGENGFYAEYRITASEYEEKETLYYIEVQNGVDFTPTEEYTLIEDETETMYVKLTPTYIQTENGIYDTIEMYTLNDDGTYDFAQRGVGYEAEPAAQLQGMYQVDHKMSYSAKETDPIVEEYQKSFDTTVTNDNRNEVIQQLDTFIRECEKDPNLKWETTWMRTQYDLFKLMNLTKETRELLDSIDSGVGTVTDIVEGNWMAIAAGKWADAQIDKISNKADSEINARLQEFLDAIYKNKDLWEKFKEFYEQAKMADTNMIMDPSGYVYETVPDNRISGVTATVYFENDLGEMEMWDAEEFNQENPQITDEEGKYAWDVPEGLWQVYYEKEGYISTSSEKLPVPPPQLEVNIPMVSEEPAVVSEVVSKGKTVTVTFDKYLDVDTITQSAFVITDGTRSIPFALELPVVIELENGMAVAKAVTLTCKENLAEGAYQLKISDSLATYAGVHLKEQTVAFTATEIKEEPTENAYVIQSVMVNDSAVTVNVTRNGEAAAEILVAAYRQNGQFVDCEMRSVALGVGETGDVSVQLETQDAYEITVFLLESGTMKPLCEAKTNR